MLECTVLNTQNSSTAIFWVINQARKGERLWVVLPHLKDLLSWENLLKSLGQSVVTLPYTAGWHGAWDEGEILRRKERNHALQFWAQNRPGSIILTTRVSLQQKVRSVSFLKAQMLPWTLAQEEGPQSLWQKLTILGYEDVDEVKSSGQVSWKGSVLDVWSGWPGEALRFYYAEDHLEMVMIFDPKTQDSLGALPDLHGHWPSMKLHDESLKQDLYEYLAPLSSEKRSHIMEAFQNQRDEYLYESLLPTLAPQDYQALWKGLADELILFWGEQPHSLVSWEAFWKEETTAYEHRDPWEIPIFFQDHWEKETPLWKVREESFLPPLGTKELQMFFLEGRGYRWWEQASLLQGKPHQLHEELETLAHKEDLRIVAFAESFEGVWSTKPSFDFQGLQPPGLYISSMAWSSGFYHHELHCIFFPLPGKKTGLTRFRSRLVSQETLEPGALVIHRQYGLGRFLGLKIVQVAGQTSELALIQYKGQDRLFIPWDQWGSLEVYKGQSEVLDSLKSTGNWERKKRKAREDSAHLAQEWLAIQAQRALFPSQDYGLEGELYERFVASFPHEETQDQKLAMEEIEKDLRSATPMDRLIVGDVGFGKTELAMRAMMRVVEAGFQAIVLAPTGLLVRQHGQTLAQRMTPFGVRIGLLGGWVAKKERENLLREWTEGEKDILVGTHALFHQKDFFKVPRLGLIVVDEEQHFGVAQKEYLKKNYPQIDMLILSATPIPRTLYMAMLGLKDLSFVQTPPVGRKAVKTFVGLWDENLVSQAIRRELARGGQVFYVHHRIQTLEETKNLLKTLVPEASVEIVHGQMSSKDLEKKVQGFLDHCWDILLCTSIVESGLHMPRVNTLLVDHSEAFGLAQLHQLRGRVGRSFYQSYAYFFSSLAETGKTKDRLRLLDQHQNLGSGLSLSYADWDARGGGNLLGQEQSGAMEEIGFSLYKELLEEEMQKCQGLNFHQAEKDQGDLEMKHLFSAFIPDDYMSSPSDRLRWYRMILFGEAREASMKDRFGPLPLQVQKLFRLSELRGLLLKLRVKKWVQKTETSFFVEKKPFSPEDRFFWTQGTKQSFFWTLDWTSQGLAQLTFSGAKDFLEEALKLLEIILDLSEEIS